MNWARFIVSAKLTIVAALMPVHAPAQDVVRCRTGRLVNVGMTSAEVISRCGEPKSRAVEEVPIFRRNANGTRSRTSEVARIERWIYERGQGQFDAVLTIEDDAVVSIEILTKP